MTKWETEISTSKQEGETVIRGRKLEEVMEMDFAKSIWLILKAETPSEDEEELFQMILSSCIDHGLGNPSTVAARTIQSGGNKMNTSVAGGILAQGEKHGGAGEKAMELLQSDKEAKKIVNEYLEEGKKIPGLGHKIYTEKDPRTDKIFEKARDLGLDGKNVQKMEKVREEFEKQKTRLVINIDGAIAAVMSDMGWEPEHGKGIFIIGRTPGLVAHVSEEMDEEPFRRQESEYTGEEP